MTRDVYNVSAMTNFYVSHFKSFHISTMRFRYKFDNCMMQLFANFKD